MNINFIDVSDKEKFDEDNYVEEKNYSINDCVLVRTTDVFPINGIVETPVHGNAIIKGDSEYFKEIILDKLHKKYPNSTYSSPNYNPEEAERVHEELQKFNVCCKLPRTTIHFCINGLVGSHAYGNFENRPFTIIEPLKNHIDSSLKSLKVEDTYFNDDIKLSSEACILIDENYYNDNKNNSDFLNNLYGLNIVVYRGNLQTAVGEVLKSKGYNSFTVSSNGYTNGLDSNCEAGKMYSFIRNFAETNNISQESHFYSEINREDKEKLIEESDIVDKEHLLYVIDNCNVEQELKDELKALIEFGYSAISDTLEKFVDLIGLDKLESLTTEFNKIKIEQYKSNSKQK